MNEINKKLVDIIYNYLPYKDKLIIHKIDYNIGIRNQRDNIVKYGRYSPNSYDSSKDHICFINKFGGMDEPMQKKINPSNVKHPYRISLIMYFLEMNKKEASILVDNDNNFIEVIQTSHDYLRDVTPTGLIGGSYGPESEDDLRNIVEKLKEPKYNVDETDIWKSLCKKMQKRRNN
jgi:hypothetical protein